MDLSVDTFRRSQLSGLAKLPHLGDTGSVITASRGHVPSLSFMAWTTMNPARTLNLSLEPFHFRVQDDKRGAIWPMW